MRRTHALLAAVGWAAAACATVAAASEHAWRTYSNVRYQYALCYPSDLLKPQGEPDAHDGQVFKAADGGVLTAFGANNALDKSLRQAAHDYVGGLGGRGAKVTYSVFRPGWAVLSGAGGDGKFYAKVIERDDQFLVFTLTYPAAAAARYDAVAAAVSRCFKD